MEGNRLDRELSEKCVERGTLRPIESLADRERMAQVERRLADRFLRTAWNLLGTDTPESAVIEGFFAMEHKANELLAVAGWRSKSHVCTQLALSRILGLPEAARVLSVAHEDRLAWNYTEEITSLRTARDLPAFVEVVERFLATLDAEIARRRG